MKRAVLLAMAATGLMQPPHQRGYRRSYSPDVPNKPKAHHLREAMAEAQAKRERKRLAKELQRKRSFAGTHKHKWVLTDFHIAECSSCGATMEGRQ